MTALSRLSATAGVALAIGIAQPGSVVASSPTSTVAPQVLGLIATKAPVPLNCENGECSGFFSAYCMQEKRPKPVAGQLYDPIGEGNLLVVAHASDGTSREFSATGLLRIESEGQYTSVKLTMDQKRLKSMNAESISIKVTPMVSLMPRMAVARAQEAIDSDMETATGPNRFVAEGFFEGNSAEAQAAAAMSQLINLLPPSGSATTEQRRTLWNRAKSAGALDNVNPQGLDRAQSTYERCKQFADMGYKVRLRGCIRKDHDQLLKDLNKKFWDRSTGF